MPRKKKKADDTPYVLTPKDAWSLLAATSNYVHAPDRAIGGKARADILAEATLAKGLSNLSDTISSIHSSVIRFHKGDYNAMQYLLECPAISDQIQEDAKGTSFATAVKQMFSPLIYVAQLEDKLRGRDVDWDASSKVLLRVKSEKFPEDLTMVEKLAVAKGAPRREKSRNT